MLELVGWVLIVLAAVPAVASVVVHAFTPWRATAVGRHLMWYMSVIAAVLVLNVVRLAFGDSTWFTVLRLAVFALVPVVLWWRLVLQIKLRHEESK